MSRAAKAAFDKQQGVNQQFASGVTGAAKGIQNIEAGIPSDLTDEQKAAYMRAAVGGIDIGAQNSADKAARFAGRTGAIAGAPELQSEIERQRARDVASAQGGAQLQLAEIPVQRAEAKAGLLGNSGQLYSSLYAPGTSLAGDLSKSAFAPNPIWGVLQGAAQGAGSAAIAACWTAAALYGEQDPRTLAIRLYVTLRENHPLVQLYLRYGKQLAALVKKSKVARWIIKPIFDHLVRRAQWLEF